MRAKFVKGQDPKKAMGIGNLYNIDFFYADHPSIEDSAVSYFIENLESAIYDIDPKAKYDIRMTDFSDGFVNFSESSLSGEDMLDMLKAKREASMGSWENNLASWDFGDVAQGQDDSGDAFDSSDYETESCDECGEEIADGNELTGFGGCESCRGEDED